jgi:hypothetical protein
MEIRWLLSPLLLGCLLIAVGYHAPEQSAGKPPEEPMVTTLPKPPEEKFSVPEPWQPTGRLPWKLTASEKEKVIEIALNTPEVSEWLESQQEYRVSDISWYALWDGGMAHFSEERVANLEVGAPGGPPNEADFYPGLTIIGDERQLQIAIDLTSEIAVYNSGPYSPAPPSGIIIPSKGS